MGDTFRAALYCHKPLGVFGLKVVELQQFHIQCMDQILYASFTRGRGENNIGVITHNLLYFHGNGINVMGNGHQSSG